MIAEHFTNPLQGFLFRMFRKVLMERKTISTVSQLIDASTEENFRITGNAEINQEKEKRASWAGVVKSGKHVEHAKKRINE